jgi:hypothetical protein
VKQKERDKGKKNKSKGKPNGEPVQKQNGQAKWKRRQGRQMKTRKKSVKAKQTSFSVLFPGH